MSEIYLYINSLYRTVSNFSMVTKIIIFIYVVLLVISLINVKRFELFDIIHEKPSITIISLIATDIVLFLVYTLCSKDTSFKEIFFSDLKPYTITFLFAALIFLIIIFAFLVYYCGWHDAASVAIVFVSSSAFITIVLIEALPIIFILLLLSIFFN